MKQLLLVTSLCWLLAAASGQQLPTPGIAQVPAPQLNDIACASLDQFGHPVIYYNPVAMNQVNIFAAYFFIAHELGHHKCGHVIARLFDANNPYVQGWLTQNAENQADAFAVDYWIQRGDKRPIQAGYNAFVAWNNPGDDTHPPSAVRAQNIAQHFAQQTNMSLFP